MIRTFLRRNYGIGRAGSRPGEASDESQGPDGPLHAEAVPGGAIVFLARWQPFGSDRLRIWRTLVPAGLEVRIVPGFHAYIVEEPFVRVLAPALEECLSRSEAAGSVGSQT